MLHFFFLKCSYKLTDSVNIANSSKKNPYRNYSLECTSFSWYSTPKLHSYGIPHTPTTETNKINLFADTTSTAFKLRHELILPPITPPRGPTPSLSYTKKKSLRRNPKIWPLTWCRLAGSTMSCVCWGWAGGVVAGAGVGGLLLPPAAANLAAVAMASSPGLLLPESATANAVLRGTAMLGSVGFWCCFFSLGAVLGNRRWGYCFTGSEPEKGDIGFVLS